MNVVIEDTPGGGLAVYDEAQHVLARVEHTTDVEPGQRLIDFCKPLPADTVLAVASAVSDHEPKKAK